MNFSQKIHLMGTLSHFMMILHNMMDSMIGKMIFIQVINLLKKMVFMMINLMIILKMTKATTALTVRDLKIMEDQDGVDQNLKEISEEG